MLAVAAVTSEIFTVYYWILHVKKISDIILQVEELKMYGFPGYPVPPPGSGPSGGAPAPTSGSPYPAVHFYGANGPDKQPTALSFLGKLH